MSLELSKSNVDCKSYPIEILEGYIKIGNEEIDPLDFCELVMYYMENTDLYPNDPRLNLIKRIENLHVIDGFSKGNCRLAQKEA